MLKISHVVKLADESTYHGAGLAWALITVDQDGNDVAVERLLYCGSYAKDVVEETRVEAANLRDGRDDARISLGIASGLEFCVATFGSAKRYLPRA